MEEKFVYLCWKVDVITADHDGYCSGEDNDELIHSDVLCLRYWVTEEEYDWLKELNSIPKFFEMFNEPDVVGDLMPVIENDDFGITGGGSGYCGESEHGLKHERKRIPIEIVGFSLDPPIDLVLWLAPSGLFEIMNANSTPLRNHLRHVRDVNHTIGQVFSFYRFPRDMIKLICQYVWNIF
jgi:hypothetical protein